MPNIAQVPQEMMALIATGFAALGGQLPTREEAQAIGAGEPICSIDAGGAVRVHPKIKKMRRRALRKAQRRPSARRSAPRLGGQPRTARAPRRTRRPAATVRAGDDGGGGDPDPEPRPLAAVSEIQTPDAAAGAGRPPKTGTAADPVLTLSDAGIDKYLADRARKYAAVPDEQFCRLAVRELGEVAP
jgi:hypothetical protein